jgi:hypothetical protein
MLITRVRLHVVSNEARPRAPVFGVAVLVALLEILAAVGVYLIVRTKW